MIMDKLKEDYINIDTRLEYMEAIAVKYVPDVDIDPATGERYVCGTTALPLFIRRYNQNKLYGNFTYGDYIANEDIQNTLKGLGVDIDKFWFLLLFIFDYTWNVLGWNESYRHWNRTAHQIHQSHS